MSNILSYLRNILGWGDGAQINQSFKRDSPEDEFLADNEIPIFKRLKHTKKTNFPEIHLREKQTQPKNVRYVPIDVEPGHPSTSTPIDASARSSKVRTVPVKLVTRNENGILTPRKPRMHTPVRPVIHTIPDDDDDEEVTLVEAQPKVVKKNPTKLYINLDEDSDNQQDDDIIYVKKVPPPFMKPVRYILQDDVSDDATTEEPKYLKLKRTRQRGSTRTQKKFSSPVGVVKTYKNAPPPLPNWMQTLPVPKSSNIALQNRTLGDYNCSRTTFHELFNFKEKKIYQELIQNFARSSKPDIINLVDDTASFRSLRRAQKKSLDEIHLVEKGIEAVKENEEAQEYGVATVASLTSSEGDVEMIPSEPLSSSYKIEPMNTLRDSYNDKPITEKNWVKDLHYNYDTKLRRLQAKISEAELKEKIISEVNSEQSFTLLSHKLKDELTIRHEKSLTDSIFEQARAAVELPPLTAEQEKMVNKALGPGPSSQVLVEKFNLRITRRDLQTLAGLNWLNDEVINFYMNLLMQRCEEKKNLPKVYATNTFFYPKLMQSGQAGIRRWTRKVDIFSHDIMVVPVHLGVHWCVSLIDFRKKKIFYLDSMGGRNQACLDALLQYLRDEHRDKKGQPFDDSGWNTESLKDIPQQMNGSDCGMFACTFAEFFTRNAPFDFQQAHMPYLRRKAVFEIISGRLLL